MLFRLITVFAVLFSSCTTTGQNKYNLDFEQINDLTRESKGWFKWSSYEVNTDTDSHSGKYSGKITSDERGVEGRMVYGIPANYNGETLQLEGYIKTKDVSEGFAGLFLKVESDQGFSLAFETMEDQQVNGTNDWKKYTVSVPYPEKAEYIFIGGILSGKGEAWFDDFVLKIDGKDVQDLKENDKNIFKAKLDREFDTGSEVALPDLNSDLISKLDLLGKVWGFLKYYHPEIARGNYNWDYELFRFLPRYVHENSPAKRDGILVKWIENYGELKKCHTCKETSKDAVLKPDLSWINDSLIGPELKSLLLEVYNNRHQGEQYYVRIHPQLGKPEFINEDPYRYRRYPDTGFRLLALYRYWNIVQYFFPYKHLIDKDWNEIQMEYLSQVVNAKDELEYELAFLKLIGEIQDTHGQLTMGNERIMSARGNYYAPFKVQFIEDHLVVTDYYKSELVDVSEIKIGDIITHINDVPIEVVVDSLREFYPASNDVVMRRDISMDILRSNKNKLQLNYITDGTNKQKRLTLYEREHLDIIDWDGNNGNDSLRMLDENIGYITLRSIQLGDINKAKQLFRETKGIIIDIRNYPNIFMPYRLGPYFVSSEAPFVKLLEANIDNPGEFNFTETLKIPPSDNPYKGKLVVLVNEFTQSRSEFTAMAFRAGHNTTIIGSTTAGADGDVSDFSLPGGMGTRISGVGIYYPDGTETQRVGIIPDIEMRPTIRGIIEGKDELLERAIEFINQN